MRYPRFAPIVISISCLFMLAGIVSSAAIPSSLQPATPSAPNNTDTTYVVRQGETLYKIAVRFNLTVKQLAEANRIANPSIIFVGQTLKIPGTAASAPTPVPAAQPDQPLAPTTALSPVGYGFDYGIEAFTYKQDLSTVTTQISQLGMQWVKQTIYWRDIEPVRGQIDFATLDEIVRGFTSVNLKILFTVTTSPAWARSYILENGPSDNLANYGTFVATLAQRYAGRVQAYEIWDEPNRRSEWSCSESTNKPSFCKSRYRDLLDIAYSAIKSVDASAVVVSAGLASTGYNDGINAIDDRLFLKDLYAAGLANISDAVGAHPLGWANPPDSVCCTASDGVSTHFDNASFYFRNTLDDYHKIIVDNKDSSTPIWVTKFGWGSSEDTSVPDTNNIYVSYTSLDEQATHISRAFELATQLGFIGPMFLSNLNGCQGGGDVESCYYSLIGPNGSPRPAYDKLGTLLAPAGDAPSVEQPTPAIPEAATNTPQEVLPTIEAAPLPLDELPPEATPLG